MIIDTCLNRRIAPIAVKRAVWAFGASLALLLMLCGCADGRVAGDGQTNSVESGEGHTVRIVVVPDYAAAKVDKAGLASIGAGGAVYMPAGIVDQVASVPGVTAVSPQLFIRRVMEDEGGCCTLTGLTVVGYDAHSDFALREIADGARAESADTLMVGANVTVGTEGSIIVVGESRSVSAKLPKTNTLLDDCFVMDIEAVRDIYADVEDAKESWESRGTLDQLVTSVMVDCDEDSVDEVAEAISSLEGATALICDR